MTSRAFERSSVIVSSSRRRCRDVLAYSRIARVFTLNPPEARSGSGSDSSLLRIRDSTFPTFAKKVARTSTRRLTNSLSPLGRPFPSYGRKKPRCISTARCRDANELLPFCLSPDYAHPRRVLLSFKPQASPSPLLPVLRPIGSCASLADGDKSAAIADINRYERGRQTKYTNVNIRPTREGAGGWRGRAGAPRRGENASNANGKSRAAGLLPFSPPGSSVTSVAREDAFRKPGPRRGECQMQFDDGEREAGGRGREEGRKEGRARAPRPKSARERELRDGAAAYYRRDMRLAGARRGGTERGSAGEEMGVGAESRSRARLPAVVVTIAAGFTIARLRADILLTRGTIKIAPLPSSSLFYCTDRAQS